MSRRLATRQWCPPSALLGSMALEILAKRMAERKGKGREERRKGKRERKGAHMGKEVKLSLFTHG